MDFSELNVSLNLYLRILVVQRNGKFRRFINRKQSTNNFISRSAPFKINNVGQNHIRVKETNEEESLIRTDTMLEGPCLFIRLEKEKGSWPFLLRNDSDFPITFSQAVSF